MGHPKTQTMQTVQTEYFVLTLGSLLSVPYVLMFVLLFVIYPHAGPYKLNIRQLIQ